MSVQTIARLQMPKWGLSMTEGLLGRWLVEEGAEVSLGDEVAEVETEKITGVVEATAAGVVRRIVAQPGDVLPVGGLLAVIADPSVSDEEIDAFVAAEPGEEEAAGAGEGGGVAEADAAPAPSRRDRAGRVKASPVARKMAKERGIDLSLVTPTGPDGRIVAEDVERAAAGGAVQSAGTKPVPPAEGEVVPLTPMRRTIAARLSEAWQAPHFALSTSMDMSQVIAVREAMVQRTPEEAVRPTYSDVLTKLCALALLRHPAVNAHYEGDSVRLFSTVNIGMAVAVPNGLVVPVIRNVERKSVAELAADRAEIVTRAQAGRLHAEDFEGGTFTISNLGMYGIEHFFAVLNPPQVAILAVGAIEERVVVESGMFVARHRVEVTLSCDHRGVDGATAAEFLRTLTEIVEQPASAL